jgi:hypothetical protein
LVKGAKDKCRSEGAGWVERKAGQGAGRERGGGDGKLKMKLENHGGKKSGLTPKAKGPTGLKSGLRVR